MALGWAKELAPQPLPLGYHVERCRSEVKPSGESGACDVGGERGWTSRLQTSLGRRAVCSAGMWETPGMRPRVGVSAIVGYSRALRGGRAGGILYVAGMPL